MKKVFISAIIFSFVLRLLLLYLNNTDSVVHFDFQQDNYLSYANLLDNQTLGASIDSNTRFFPGYPLLIFAVSKLFFIPMVYSALLINFLSLIGSIVIFYKLTKSKIQTIIFSFLPWIWLIAPIKIATEPLIVFLLLFALYLFFEKKYLIMGIVFGFSFLVRPIGICLFLALIVVNYKKIRQVLAPMIIGFTFSVIFLFAYNFIIFNDLFYQFRIYPKIGGAGGSSIAIIQIFKDVLRAIDWGQYRILISGLVHIFLTFLATLMLFKFKNKKNYKIYFYWSMFSLMYIFSYGPTPLLEEFRRFIIPVLPALIIGITLLFKKPSRLC